MDGEKYLNEFFVKSLLISGSANSVNNQWGSNLLFKLDRHIFTDPFNIDITSDPEQVAHFNEIFKSNDKVIKWRKSIDSKQSIVINKDNKDEVINTFIQQNYLMLSVALFENLLTLLKQLLELKFGDVVFYTKKKCIKNSAKHVLILFYNKFEKQINQIEGKILNDYTSFSSIHNLRMFRNCIVHNNAEIKNIEEEYLQDIQRLKLKPNLFFYKIINGKLSLDSTSFNDLSDLYSQLAYIVHLCYVECE